LQRDYFDPGNGLMYQKGSRLGYVALESLKTVAAAPSMPEVDQVHISAALGEVWGRDLMDAVQRVAPTFEREPTIRRILELRWKLREEVAKELVEYRVREPSM
jgi:hypothetical protein